MKRAWRITLTCPCARKKKLCPGSFSFTMGVARFTRVHWPARASSHSSESASAVSMGTRLSATYFSLSEISSTGSTRRTTFDRSSANSAQVG